MLEDTFLVWPASAGVEEDDVGEGAADVDADAYSAHRCNVSIDETSFAGSRLAARVDISPGGLLDGVRAGLGDLTILL